MLSAIVHFSVRFRGIVIALAVVLLAYGVTVLAATRYDVFPEFAPPQVAIQTEAPGFTPEQVEMLVTTPIENAINGVPGIATVRSQSIQGVSVITSVFADGTDIYRARQVVAERLTEVARGLATTVKTPVMTPLTSSTGTVLVIGLTSRTRSLMDERTFADWTLKPRLLAVPGVARVSVFGGEVRQLQIQLDPVRLRALGLSIADVVTAASNATGVRGAGVIDNANQRIVVRTEAQLRTPALLAQSVIRESRGAVISLGDVGRVVEGAEPRVGAAAVEGTPGVVMNIDAQLGGNIRDVSAAVERALTDVQPTITAEGYVVHPTLFRPATFVDVALSNITHSLLLGGVLVTIVLLLFLADFGAAAVSLTAIPLSLLTAIIVLNQLGVSVSTLSLAGLAIAIGEVVDDAIIDVENIARRLRENRALGNPRSAPEVVIDASLEVRSSVVYATFIVALVFLPVIALSGVQGALFRPLGLAYIFAILASLAVALTVTPALTLVFLARRAQHAGESRFLSRLKRSYTGQLVAFERHPKTVMATTGGLILVAVIMIPFFGATFLPDFNEGHYIVHMSAVPGTSLDESLRLGRIATAVMRADPRVLSVAQKVGRAELAEDTWGTHYSEFDVNLAPLSGEGAERLQSNLGARLAQIPGVVFAIKPFLTERIEESVSGSTAPVVVKLFGNDLDSLDAGARTVAAIVRATPGAGGVQVGAPSVAPEATVQFHPDALAAVGIPAGEALTAVETATTGATVAQAFEGNIATDVVVMLNHAQITRPEDLANIPLSGSMSGSNGRIVTLGQVATIARTTGRYSISHEGARRVQLVTSDVTGSDVASFTDALGNALARVRLPRGVYTEIAGTAAAQKTAQHELLLRSLLAAAGIAMLLWMAFGSTRRMLLVLANLPFALVGGVFAVFATGGVLSLGSLVGFVTLFGISTRNAIMLISHYDHLVRVEGATWGIETAIRGATERLGPVTMTALVTALGLLPLAIGSGAPGREIEGPLAIVILGGLVTSTALTLFVLPTLALRYGRFGELQTT
ncbi:MAG: efflux RND transporter permease subunit [Gemmatimonadota bacterium]|nr:efflux RND transporter permease subunit [Gemmatimonadota bacterium]